MFNEVLSVEIREHVDPPGTFVAHVAVSDAESAETGCQLQQDGGDEHFRLEPLVDGGEYKLVTTTTFDREEKDRYVGCSI